MLWLVIKNKEKKIMNSNKIDRSKVVFIALNNGEWVDKHGYGAERFNFDNVDGQFYGFTPRTGKINLRNISDDIKTDKNGQKYLDNVLVVFTTKDSGRVINGFYKNATVYAEPIQNAMPNRYMENIKDFAPYNLICTESDCYQIPEKSYNYRIPHASVKKGVAGYGQSQIWYANQAKDDKARNGAIDYVCGIIDLNDAIIEAEYNYDELKYLDRSEFLEFLEGKSTTALAISRQRSSKARKGCIDHYGTVCQICGFDFEKVYGEIGKGHITVHHIEPLFRATAKQNGEVDTDPIKDLLPVCSNCHSMLHSKKETYTIDEIRNSIKKA
jgi:5-methylcytosine-specific restriction protein A